MSFPLEAIPQQYELMFMTMHNIATAYAYGGRLNDVTRLLSSFADIATHDDVSDRMHVEMLLTYVHWETIRVSMEGGSYERATRAIKKAQTLMMDKVQRGRVLDLQGNIAYSEALYSNQNDFSKAKELFHAAIVALAGEDSPQNLCWAVFHVGLVHQQSNEIKDAHSHFERAAKLARIHKLELETSYIVYQQGLSLLAEKKFDEALKALKESAEIREKIGFKMFLPLSYLAVAQVYEQMEQKHDALKYYEVALKLARKLGITRQLIVVLIEHGKMLQAMNRSEEAQTLFKQAEPHAHTIDDAQSLILIKGKVESLDNSEKAPESK